jgi:hypothetical protein
MPNTRTYFPILQVGASKVGLTGGTAFIAAHGVQSAGRNTDLNINRIYQLGESKPYDNVETVPDVTMTMEKVFDGYAPLWTLARNGSSSASLLASLNIPSTWAMSVFSDQQDSASGTPINQVIQSGMFVNSYSISLPVDGSPFSETMGLIGSNAEWSTGVGYVPFSGAFSNTDLPFAYTAGSGGVQTREDFVFGPLGTHPKELSGTPDVNGQIKIFYTILPPDIQGINSSGVNVRNADGSFSSHIREISISPSISREALYEQGRRVPYLRYATIPIEVTTTIAVACTAGDLFSVRDTGTQTGINTGNNTSNRSIYIRLREGTWIDLGTSNRLTSVSQTGGDTGGGIATLQYTYVTANTMTITHPQDPGGLTWPY